MPATEKAIATGRLVLIVEDNPDGRQSMLDMLTLCGVEVASAADGAEGVVRALALRPRVALVDIGLPILDGFDVARELRRHLGGSVLLIAHTAYSDSATRARAREAGFDHLLAKPCSLSELLTLLRGAGC